MLNKYLKIFLIVLIIVIMSFGFFNAVNAATANTGSVLCFAWGNYKNEFTNPKNALTQNNVYATSVVGTAGNNEEDYYVFYGVPSMLAGYDVKSIDGITVSIDAYASSTGCYSTVQLSWNGGVSFTGTKTTSNWGTSDTNTYLSVGGSSDTWSRTWVSSEFTVGNFDVYIYSYGNLATKTIYYDHVVITVYFTYYPKCPTNFEGMVKECGENGISLSWVKGTGSDYTRIQRRNDKFPTGISDGDNIYNSTGTGTEDDTDLECGDTYYYAAWGYSSSDKLWSTSQSFAVVTWCGDCVECDLTVVNNTAHTTGKYETAQDGDGCYTIWLNYTGEIPDLRQEENIINATGTHEYYWDNAHWSFIDFANYTGDTTPIKNLFENYVNATGTLEYALSENGYLIWANISGNTTPIKLIDTNNKFSNTNVDYILGSNGWYFWINSTGVTTPIMNLYENYVNATGTLEYSLYTDGLTEKYWTIYSNVTGDTTPIADIDYDLVNGTGQTEYNLQGDGWHLFSNFTGTTLGIVLYENFVNAIGTHEYTTNTTHYLVWANVTGNVTECNSTGLTIDNNNVNVTGNYGSSYNSTSGWYIWLNYSGLPYYLNLFQNIINATGTHQYNLISNPTNYTYNCWANYTGTGGGGETVFVNNTGNAILNRPSEIGSYLMFGTVFLPVGLIIGRKRRRKRKYD